MLKFFVLLLIVTGLIIGLSVLIQRDAGYLLLSYDGVSIESSLWAGLAALALALFVLYWLIRLIMKIRYSGRSLRYWRDGRQARRNEAQVTQGLIQYMEGDWKSSAKTFSRGAAKSPTPLLSYLMAARASNAAGDYQQCEELLKQAEASTPDAHVAIGLTQAEMQLEKGEYENCLANLNRIKEAQPENNLALTMSASVYEALGDWRSLQEVLPTLRKKKLLSADQLAELEFKTFDNKLRAATSADSLSTEWGEVPKAAKKDQRLLSSYAGALVDHGNGEQAETLLRAALKKNWSADLIQQYGKVQGKDLGKQLSAAEGWLKNKPDDADLLLAAGRISMRNDNLDKAKDYLTASAGIKPDPETYGELGRLMAQLGDTEQSSQQYQKALGIDVAVEKETEQETVALPKPDAESPATEQKPADS